MIRIPVAGGAEGAKQIPGTWYLVPEEARQNVYRYNSVNCYIV